LQSAKFKELDADRLRAVCGGNLKNFPRRLYGLIGQHDRLNGLGYRRHSYEIGPRHRLLDYRQALWSRRPLLPFSRTIN
jgi:hypothetical protein